MGVTETFKAMSDVQRRAILDMLKDGRMNAGEIAQRLGITHAALSYHLRLLKGAELITEYKEKNFVYYELNTSVFDELVLWLGQFGGRRNENGKNAGAVDNSFDKPDNDRRGDDFPAG